MSDADWTIATALAHLRALVAEAEKRRAIELVAVRDQLVDMDRRIQMQLEAIDRAGKLAMDVAREADDKSDKALESRLDHLNEFRQAMSDQTRDFVTRVEFRALLMAMVAIVSVVVAAFGVFGR